MISTYKSLIFLVNYYISNQTDGIYIVDEF